MQTALEKEQRLDLASQLPGLRLTARCGCGDWFCASFDVGHPGVPYLGRRSTSRPKGRESIDFEVDAGMVICGVDELGRITGFEVLYRADVRSKLNKLDLPATD